MDRHLRAGIAILASLAGLAVIVPPAALGAAGTAKVVVNAGSADVAISAAKQSVQIPITISAPAASPVTVRWRVVGGSAVVGRNVEAGSGTIRFSGGATEAFASVTVLPYRIAPTSPCWYQGGDCLSYSLQLSVLAGPGTLSSAAPTTDSIMWLSGASGLGVAAGDTLVPLPLRSKDIEARIPVSLSERAKENVDVRYATLLASASPGLDYIATQGTLRIRAGAVGGIVTVRLPTNHQTEPFEAFGVVLRHASPGVVIARSTGTVVMATSGDGVVGTTNGYESATLTQLVSASGVGDTYSVTTPGDASADVVASPNIAGGNDRVVFWPSSEVPTADEESCVTWSDQTPSQADLAPNQEGIALRVATFGGITRAITLTKNIYGSSLTSRAYQEINVHIWSTTKQYPFVQIGSFSIASYLAASSDSNELPLDVCARVVGDMFEAALWAPGQPVPDWGASGQGITLQLPAGWDYPGEAGWYAGHLPSNGTIDYTNEYEGAPTATPEP